MAQNDRIIFAVDVATREAALKWTADLRGHVGWFKVGLELFTAVGPELVRDITGGGINCFLDLKFHDIPNTVAGAVSSVSSLGARMMTIHISGGRKMMVAAVDAAKNYAAETGAERPEIIGVSILTSLDQTDMDDLGFSRKPSEQAARLAELAVSSGLDGMVCSPADLELVRQAVPPEFKIITPGIRPTWAAKNDQARIATPRMAVDNGANLLVIGRPISHADNPSEAADRIAAELQD